MAQIIGLGQLSLLDLNDAIVSLTEPTNPSIGTMWIDESVAPNPMLKRWNGTIWVELGELDPNLSSTITDIQETLGNMANDSIIDYNERQVVKDKLTEILGYVIADTTTTLPTTATLDGSAKGGFYSVRKSALNAGIPSTDPKYIAVADAWDKASPQGLKQYLESLTPIDVWDLRTINQDQYITVDKATFRDKWLKYFLAVNDLATATADKLRQNVDDVQVGARNFASNGDFSQPLNTARWASGYTGQTIDIADISAETPPFQFALHVKNTTNANGGIFYGDMFTGEIANSLVGKDLTIQFWLKYQNIVQGTNTWNDGRFGELVIEGETSTGTKVYSYPYVLSEVVGTNMTWTKQSKTIRISLPSSAIKLTKISLKHGLEGATGEFWTTGIKVETGNKITDWSENPLDMQGRVYNVEQKVLPDSIVSTVRSSETYQQDLTNIENKVAKILTLSSTSSIMTYDALNNASPSTQTITFTANLQNLTGTATFTATPYDSAGTAMTAITLGGSGNTRTLTASQFGTTAVRVVVTATLSGYSDTITIVKVKDGAKGDTGGTGSAGKDAIVGFLTNESITLSANESGVVSDFSTATGTFEVYDGITKKTGTSVTYAVTGQTGCTVSITTAGVYSVGSMSSDTATATMTATYGGVIITKTLSLSKSRKGTTGVGVSSVTEYYLATSASSGVTTSTTGWTTTIQTLTATNKYLWNYEKITYTDSTTQNTSPIIIGVYGDTGNAGKGISSITEYYLATSASTGVTTATTGWTTTIQTVTATNKYLWNYEKITYTDSSTVTINPVIIGAYGDKGDKGDAGISVTSIVEEYYQSTSSTTQTGGAWSTTVPTWADGKYVWTRAKTTFSDSSTAYTSPVNVTGSKGTNGTTYYTWVKYADDASGTGMSDSPADKRYIGIATNKTTSTESNVASDYTWSPLYDNVVVGGTNLWLKSSVEDSFALWGVGDGVKTLDNDFLWNGKATIKFVKGSVSVGGLNNSSVRSGLPANTQFTYSFMVYSDTASAINSSSLGHMQVVGTSDSTNVHRETAITYSPSTLTANTWTKVSITFKTPIEAVAGETFTFRSYLWYLTYGATYYFADFKLEKGNISSDWTPAPEDIQSQFDNKADSSIVETLTSEYNASLAQTTTDITASVDQKLLNQKGEIEKAYKAEVQTAVDSFNVTFTEMDGRVTNLDGSMTEVKSYFKFEPTGLTVGKSDSPLNITVSNSEIDFVDNGSVVAYINGKMMYIDSLEVLTSLLVGNHKIEKYSSEITLVKYSG